MRSRLGFEQQKIDKKIFSQTIVRRTEIKIKVSPQVNSYLPTSQAN